MDAAQQRPFGVSSCCELRAQRPKDESEAKQVGGVGDFRKVWASARIATGLDGRVVHDLRRPRPRDFRRAGVSEGEIMKLCGWKTRDMFDRYNIIDQADLSRAVARRFGNVPSDNGKGTANTEADPAEVRELTPYIATSPL